MKKVALLIDGEWFRRSLENALGALPAGVTAELMYSNALRAVDPGIEEILRIFYYDSEPSTGISTNPISGAQIQNTSQAKTTSRKRFFDELGRKPFVALRRGVIRPRGWTLKSSYLKRLIKGGQVPPPTGSDVSLTMVQKGVDMRIGIDVATLSTKRLVDRIILFSGDTDMIPAIKLARREGVQVVMVQIPGRRLTSELVEDSDLVRDVIPQR